MNNKFLVAIFCAAFSLSGFSESSARTMVISAEPVKGLHGSLSALFQYKLTNFMALTVPGTFGTNWLAVGFPKTMAVITDAKYDASLLFGGGGLGARFFLNNNGLSDGFFAEPRVMVGMSKYTLNKDTTKLIDSNRVTLSPSLLLGYSWFWDNGFYLSTGISAGFGYHVKNDIAVEEGLASRLANKYFLRNCLWADKGSFRFDYGYDVSLGFAW